MAVLQNRQAGSLSVSAGNSSNTATVSSFTLANSILFYSVRGGYNTPDGFAVRGVKTNTTTLTFSRPGTAGTLTIEWELLEFDTDVSVQDIDTSVSQTTTTTISAVTLANTFIVFGGRSRTGGTLSLDDLSSAYLSDTTTVQWRTETATGANCAIQVVEHAGASVQNLQGFRSSDTATSFTVSPSSLDLSLTALFGSASTNISSMGMDNIWRISLTNATTITVDRTTGDSDGWHYSIDAVEFDDGTSVQDGQQAIGSSTTQQDITISAVTIDETASRLSSLSNWGGSGSKSAETDDDSRTSFFTAKLTTTTNLQVERDASDSFTADIHWNVIEWNVGAVASEGSLDEQFEDLTASGSGDVSISGSLNESLGDLALDGSGSVLISGSLGETLGDLSLGGSGEVDIMGSLDQSLGELTGAGAGTVAISGSLDSSLEDLSNAGSGTVLVSGGFDQSLDDLQVDASGGSYTGASLDATLGDLTLAGSGETGIQGIFDQSLEDVALAGSGAVLISGSLDQSLGDMSISGSGETLIEGSLDSSLEDLTGEGTGETGIEGSLVSTLGDIALDGVGAVLVSGSLNQSFEDLGVSGSGEVAIEGSLDSTLDDLVVSATAGRFSNGSLDAILDNLVVSGSGEVAIIGVFNQSLDDISLDAFGVPLITNPREIILTASARDKDLNAEGRSKILYGDSRNKDLTGEQRIKILKADPRDKTLTAEENEGD